MRNQKSRFNSCSPQPSVDAVDWLRRKLSLDGGFPTPLAAMMTCRWACLALVIIAALQSLVVALEIPGWPCPLRTATGIPCPGCGLSRACASLLHGEWSHALEYHAFSYGVPVVLAALLFPSLTGGQLRQGLIGAVHWLERQTGFTTIGAIGFLLYYVVRLLIFPRAFLLAVGS